MENKEMEEPALRKARSGKETVIIVIVATLVVLALVIGIVAYQNSPVQRYRKQIELAEKYLSELDYDNAILAYRIPF